MSRREETQPTDGPGRPDDRPSPEPGGSEGSGKSPPRPPIVILDPGTRKEVPEQPPAEDVTVRNDD